MPTITISRKAFDGLVGKKLSDEKLKDRISYLGTDLEGVTPDEITVEVFPNRPDMLSVQGFARAFSSFIGSKTGLRNYTATDSKEKVIIDKSVQNVRPYTACAIVKGLRFDDEKIKEVIQIQEKLHVTYGRNRRKVAIGIYPGEKIAYPITFKALPPEDIRFQPLEGRSVMDAERILRSHPAGREYGHLLEGRKAYPVFVDAKGRILSMPPIINSHDVGKISGKTTDVFIECSGFDFDTLSKCLNIIVTALIDMGGKAYCMKLEYPDRRALTTPDLKPGRLKADLGYINRVLGLSLRDPEFKRLLERMGFGYERGSIIVPAYRADILHQSDIAEDIAIAYGFENFRPAIPSCATIGEEDPFEAFKGKAVGLLAGLGMIECNTFNLTSRQNQEAMMEFRTPLIEIANSLSQEYDVLRAWVLPSLFEVLRANKHHDYPQNIFTTGTVFRKNPAADTGVGESERLAVALCSDRSDYTSARQALDYLMRSLGAECSVRPAEHPSFIEGRVGRVSAKGKDIAYIGEISPKVLENWGLVLPVSCFELNLTELFSMLGNT